MAFRSARRSTESFKLRARDGVRRNAGPSGGAALALARRVPDRSRSRSVPGAVASRGRGEPSANRRLHPRGESHQLERSAVDRVRARSRDSLHGEARAVRDAGHPGQPLGFFAEGHRSESGQLIRGRPGVAYVAQHSGALLVPLAVSGTRGARLGAFWRRDIVIRVGNPFHAADLAVKADDPQAVTDAIMRRVAALMPLEQRGVYR